MDTDPLVGCTDPHQNVTDPQHCWKEKKYLEEEADEVDEPQPGISQEEEDEVRPLGVGEAG